MENIKNSSKDKDYSQAIKSNDNLDLMCVNHLKNLVLDAINKSNSGHPGGAMSSMDFAYILFSEFLKFDPNDPDFFARDRFVLSAGHESMLYYAILYALGWLSIDDIKNFRSLHSKTPGHPENHLTSGIECTTGPLGQGAGMSVGMAIASKHLKHTLDKTLFNQKIWCLLGDGCIQEEITSGSASLAAHLGLSNLIWFYDRNKAQISGDIDRVTSVDDSQYFKALGWHVEYIKDGHDHSLLRKTMKACVNQTKKPSIIIADTTIAKGAYSLEGSYKTHGAAFKKDELLATKAKLNIKNIEPFYFPEHLIKHFRKKANNNLDYVKSLKFNLNKLLKNNDFKKSYDSYFSKKLNFKAINHDYNKPIATRASFGQLLANNANNIKNLIGGSADLEPSNYTHKFAQIVGDFSNMHPRGRNIAFGVREFTMAAVSNGISLFGGFRVFCATFLVFSDYLRAAIRLSAIQKTNVVYEFTHDSFYVGEDGPTHQPIEHIMSLRLIPDLYVFRPSDGYETELLFKKALELDKPVCMILSRQKLDYLITVKNNLINKNHVNENLADKKLYSDALRGGWIVKDFKNDFNSYDLNLIKKYIIFSSGSEVALALECAYNLEKNDKFTSVKVVNLCSWELFFENSDNYIKRIMSYECQRRISIEAGSRSGWQKFTGMNGLNIGLDRFGASAKADDLKTYFGFCQSFILNKISNHFDQ